MVDRFRIALYLKSMSIVNLNEYKLIKSHLDTLNAIKSKDKKIKKNEIQQY